MNLNVLKAIFRRDFVSYFSSPTGYVFICVFVVLSALATFWPPEFFANNLANLDQLSRWLPFIMLVFIPAITMSIWAEERRQGTDELLLTIPASDFEVVLGKYLAGVAIFTVSLIFSAVSIFTVFKYGLGDPDFGLFLSTYVGYWFIGIAMIAIGMVASFITDNLTVGFILGTLFNMPLALFGVAGWFIKDPAVAQKVRQWSALEQFRDFERGVISLGGIAYFVGIAAVMIYLSMILIGRRHWQAREDGESLWGHYLVRTLALLILAAAATVLIQDHNWLRADVSSERLSSLSPETVQLISDLKKEEGNPITIDAYFSPEVPQQYAALKLNFLATLEELSALGGDRIRVVPHEIENYGEEAEKAEKNFGITPQEQLIEDGPERRLEEFFLGAAFTSGLDKVSVPFINPGVPVEYELVRSILTVAQPKRLTLGMVNTGIPEFDVDRPGAEDAPLIAELRKQYDVKAVDPTQPIKGNYDVLLAIQPSMLGPQEMDHLVDAIRDERIPTALFEDPFPRYFNPQSVAGTSQPRQMNMGGMGGMFGGPQTIPKGDIEQLWKALGVEFNATAVVWQDYFPDVTVRGFQEPAWVFVDDGNGSPQPFSDDSEITAGLNQALLLFPGHVSRANDSKLDFLPLLNSGVENSGIVPVFAIDRFRRMSGQDALQQGLTRDAYILAAQINGTPNVEMDAVLEAGADEAEDPADLLDKQEAAADSEETAAAATEEPDMNVVLVCDIDWIVQDFFQIRARGSKDFLPTTQNVTLMLNILDHLAGEERFLSIRKRARKHRTLTNVDTATEAARQRAFEEEEQFVKEFQEAEAEANEEFQKKIEGIEKRTDLSDRQKEILLAQVQRRAQQELQAKIEAATTAQRRKIKKSKNDLEQDIRTIQDKYKLFSILIPPIPPMLLALAVYFRRREAERQGVARERLR